MVLRGEPKLSLPVGRVMTINDAVQPSNDDNVHQPTNGSSRRKCARKSGYRMNFINKTKKKSKAKCRRHTELESYEDMDLLELDDLPPEPLFEVARSLAACPKSVLATSLAADTLHAVLLTGNSRHRHQMVFLSEEFSGLLPSVEEFSGLLPSIYCDLFHLDDFDTTPSPERVRSWKSIWSWGWSDDELLGVIVDTAIWWVG